MPRDADTTNAYLHEFFDEAEEKPCPGCNGGWSAGRRGGRQRVHANDCDYLRWIDDEELKNGPATYRSGSHQ